MATREPAADGRPRYAALGDDEETLVHVLDRVLDVGLVAVGDLKITVADVELIYVGLKLVVCSADKIAGSPTIERAFGPVRPAARPAV
ncbi:MAG: gas vesicle protein [Parvularculaceae bacterium]